MKLIFISRSDYKLKEKSTSVKRLLAQLKNPFVIPEGGTNNLAIKGCEDILNDTTKAYDYICCPVGTGGTISGLINASEKHQKIIGFSALKGGFLKEDISRFVLKDNWTLQNDYHFGGYAKINTDLIKFINQFKSQNQIALDPIYTGKMLFGIYDLISKAYFKPNSRILAIHTGGLQGIEGVNAKLKTKKLPLII
jgi:1-aminocyclopropane-1-carboxylate deaminase